MVTVGASFGLRLGLWLNKRHPFVVALLAILFFVITGGVAALFVDSMLRSRGPGQVPFVVAGATLGALGAGLWAYAFAKGFEVPLWIGRGTVGFTLAAGVAAFGAFLTGPPIQVLCASAVAARLLPQAMFAIIQGLQDTRDPKGRQARVVRAMTMAQRK